MERRLDKLDKKDETENHPPISNQVFFPENVRICTVAAGSDQFPAHLKFFILACCLQCNYLRYVTLKTKNTCFTVENLRLVHAVRMITTTFLAVFRFVWMRNVQNVMFMGELCACPRLVLCAVLNVNKLQMQVPSCTCISTTHAINPCIHSHR